jgi:hypothetical protein
MAGAVRAKEDDRLKELATQFRVIERDPVAILRRAAAMGDEKAFRFLVEVVRKPRHADLVDEVLQMMARTGRESGVVAALFRERLGRDDPYRRMARDFLLRRAVSRRDDDWLTVTFGSSILEDRFLALEGMGAIGSGSTMRAAWTLLRDSRWRPEEGTPVHLGTIARAVRSFEGTDAARLLLLLQRDKRFRPKDREAVRDATRLWASGDLHSYVRLSDLAHPDDARRAESAQFMGEAGIEAARAPLVMLARNPREPIAVRAAATEALGGLRIARADLAATLAALLQDEDSRVRSAAVAGLAGLRVRQAAAALVDLIGTPLEEIARSALADSNDLPANQDWKDWLATCMLPKGT